jgi:hypothetical protein
MNYDLCAAVLRIRDVYPGSRMFIPDLGSRVQKQIQKKGVKKNCCPTFFCSHKNHKNENYINFELVKKKIWAHLQRIIELSAQKFVIKLGLGSGIRDPGSGKKSVLDPGSRIQGSKRRRIPDPGSATLM